MNEDITKLQDDIVDQNDIIDRGRLGQVDKASTPHVVGYPLVSGSSPSPFNEGLSGFVGFTLR